MKSGLKKAAKFAAFIKKHRLIIIGHGIWATASWIYDNPFWWLIELHYGVKGVVAMMFGAVLINFFVLLYYRRKKVSWLGWDQGAEALKKKEQWLRRNSVRIYLTLVIIMSYVLYVPNEIPWQIIPISTAIAIVTGIFIVFLKVRIAEDIFALFFFSIAEDSFIATAYMRHGRTDGLRFRDYVVFFISSVISVGYWAVRNGIAVEAIIRPLTKV